MAERWLCGCACDCPELHWVFLRLLPPPTQAAGVATAAWPHATNAVAAALTWNVPGPEPEASPLPTGTICTLMLCPGVILFETKPFIKALVGSPSWARTPGWDQRAARLLYEMLWGTLPS